MRHMQINEKLNLLAERTGIGPAAVGHRLKIAKSTISNWYNGKGKPPLDRALQIARLYGVSLDYLADDARDVPDPPPSEYERMVREVVAFIGPERAYRRLVNVEDREGGETRGLGPGAKMYDANNSGSNSGGNAKDPNDPPGEVHPRTKRGIK